MKLEQSYTLPPPLAPRRYDAWPLFAMLAAQEAPDVEVLAVLVVWLTRSLLLESTLVLLEEVLFDEDELELFEELELVEGAAAELLEELELEAPAPGIVSWSPG